MSRRASVLVLVLALGVTTGVFVTFLQKGRAMAACTGCRNNLGRLGLACTSYHLSHGSFPPGTVPNASLPAERRLSWLVEGWAYFGDGQVDLLIDRAAAWDEEGNRRAEIDLLYYPDSRKRKPVGRLARIPLPVQPRSDLAGGDPLCRSRRSRAGHGGLESGPSEWRRLRLRPSDEARGHYGWGHHHDAADRDEPRQWALDGWRPIDRPRTRSGGPCLPR
jgi:hypothetical protein